MTQVLKKCFVVESLTFSWNGLHLDWIKNICDKVENKYNSSILQFYYGYCNCVVRIFSQEQNFQLSYNGFYSSKERPWVWSLIWFRNSQLFDLNWIKNLCVKDEEK